MKKSDSFECVYSVSDGYVGKGRPKYFNICASDIEDDMTDDDLERLFDESMRDDFDQNVAPEPHNIDEFVEWARGIRDAMGE